MIVTGCCVRVLCPLGRGTHEHCVLRRTLGVLVYSMP